MSLASADARLPLPHRRPDPTTSVDRRWASPPRMMLGNDRPMASLIIFVSSAPDVPTKVPATTRIRFDRANPSAATANPVNEFSIEISTGVSAPPTGRQMPTPRPSASTADR